VDQWAARRQAPGIRIDWLDIEGDPAQVITDHGRRADAIVIARPAAQAHERIHRTLHAALFATGCKVLVVPETHRGRIGQVVAIAWKDDERAGKAVRDTLPILGQAKEVHVLCAGSPATWPRVLQDHGIPAVLHDVPDGPAPVAARLLDAAHRVGADLLVMGAFAHGEWRERLFGGVTRHMLAHADMPLLMRH
jgi:nucleotide-binding universal stress UspA family protein